MVKESKMFIWTYLLTVLAAALAQDSMLVNLTQGPVLGYKSDDADVFSFYGIPYATVPKGRDKFKGPLPGPVWTETLEAVDGTIICPQFEADIYHPGANVKEDCLVANVFVPNTKEKDLPVLVVIHGGAFLVGYGNAETPEQFVESKKIVTITINYRLGPHGFLCLGTEDIPGNAGIKDQVAALRWINANVAKFGGDPNNVTIAGCSAGGAAVDLLMLSKSTKGLFNKVIGQSGANVAPYALQVDPMENAKFYAEKIKFSGGDLAAMEEFYKSISFEQLFSFSLDTNKDHVLKFSPCVERDVGTETFLDDDAVNIMKSGNYERYPMLYGYTDMDGLLRIRKFEEFKNIMNEDFTQFVPGDLQFESAEKEGEVAEDIKHFYFGEDPVSNKTVLEYVDFFTDAMFIYPMHRSVTLQVESGNDDIYLHVYSFTDENTPYVPHTNVQGVAHCLHTRSIFDEDYSKLTPEYVQMKENMREIWNDFIRTGNPTPDWSSIPKWPPARSNRAPCMNLGRTIELQGTYAKNRTDFWNSIYEKYYRHPAPPSSSASASVNLLLFISLIALLRLLPVRR